VSDARTGRRNRRGPGPESGLPSRCFQHPDSEMIRNHSVTAATHQCHRAVMPASQNAPSVISPSRSPQQYHLATVSNACTLATQRVRPLSPGQNHSCSNLRTSKAQQLQPVQLSENHHSSTTMAASSRAHRRLGLHCSTWSQHCSHRNPAITPASKPLQPSGPVHRRNPSTPPPHQRYH
jgi:hypothetical protein